MRKSIKIEHYIRLQQNTIDAQENPYEVIVSNKLYEQQDYVLETNHLPHLISPVVSKDFYNQLTEENQQILAEAQEITKNTPGRYPTNESARRFRSFRTAAPKSSHWISRHGKK